jgi:hypothetical protein
MTARAVQKTWTELLGAPDGTERVERDPGNRFAIVRPVGRETWRVLWTFESNADALGALAAWQSGR